MDIFQVRKWFRIMMATNEPHVVSALHDDRRYLVLEVDAGERNRDREYFEAMHRQWFDEGGRVAFFRWLTGRWWRDRLESGAWNVGQRPETAALQRQKDMSLVPAQLVVHNMLEQGDMPCEFTSHADTVFVPTSLLAHARRLGDGDMTALGRAIGAAAGPGVKSVRAAFAGGRRPRGYWLPPLELARQNWERFIGRKVEWPDDVTSWAVDAVPMREDDDLPF